MWNLTKQNKTMTDTGNGLVVAGVAGGKTGEDGQGKEVHTYSYITSPGM